MNIDEVRDFRSPHGGVASNSMRIHTKTGKAKLIDVGKDIRSLTEFKRDTTRCLADLEANGRTMLLTVNGEAALAVMSAETFQQVLDALDVLDTLRCIREGLEQGKRGEGASVDEFFKAFRGKNKVGKRA